MDPASFAGPDGNLQPLRYPGVVMKVEEHFFTCPCCWQRISMLFDLSAGSQCYFEDCEVCCAPIRVHFQTDGDQVFDLVAEAD